MVVCVRKVRNVQLLQAGDWEAQQTGPMLQPAASYIIRMLTSLSSVIWNNKQ